MLPHFNAHAEDVTATSATSAATHHLPVEGAVEVIPGRLYWAAVSTQPPDNTKMHFFSIDEELVYEPFAEDFGPLNLAHVCRYCRSLERKLAQASRENKKLIHACSKAPQKKTNAACLICCYQVVVLGKSPEAAYEPFRRARPGFFPYRDALTNKSTFDIDIIDCLRGLQKAIDLGWFDWKAFSVESYEWFSQVEHGDLNWVVPGKFIAFAGPSDTEVGDDGFKCFTPEDYLRVFVKANIGLVVRLNSKQYNRNRFINNGVKHIDLYFKDGSCPPEAIIAKFLHVAEAEQGAVAVHCKAGLGRTGTLIGLYAMKHYQFPARAFIAWNRMCRPGSILGPQQQYLVSMQEEMFQAGVAMQRPHLRGGLQDPHALRRTSSGSALRRASKEASDHDAELRIRAELHTDIGQGERLCAARRGGTPNHRMQALTTHDGSLTFEDERSLHDAERWPAYCHGSAGKSPLSEVDTVATPADFCKRKSAPDMALVYGYPHQLHRRLDRPERPLSLPSLDGRRHHTAW